MSKCVTCQRLAACGIILFTSLAQTWRLLGSKCVCHRISLQALDKFQEWTDWFHAAMFLRTKELQAAEWTYSFAMMFWNCLTSYLLNYLGFDSNPSCPKSKTPYVSTLSLPTSFQHVGGQAAPSRLGLWDISVVTASVISCCLSRVARHPGGAPWVMILIALLLSWTPISHGPLQFSDFFGGQGLHYDCCVEDMYVPVSSWVCFQTSGLWLLLRWSLQARRHQPCRGWATQVTCTTWTGDCPWTS